MLSEGRAGVDSCYSLKDGKLVIERGCYQRTCTNW